MGLQNPNLIIKAPILGFRGLGLRVGRRGEWGLRSCVWVEVELKASLAGLIFSSGS